MRASRVQARASVQSANMHQLDRMLALPVRCLENMPFGVGSEPRVLASGCATRGDGEKEERDARKPERSNSLARLLLRPSRRSKD